MFRPLVLGSLLTFLAAPITLAQSDPAQTDGEPADGTTTQEAPPEPEYNGSVSGTAAGTAFNVQVVCEGFGTGGPVSLQSDPGGGGQDANGDGKVVSITASPDGNISLSLMNGNNVFNMNDSTAVLSGKSLTYSITMTFSGGATEEVNLNASCQ